MSEEVKRYDLTIEELGSSEDGYLEQFIESSDGEYVKLSDFKSERALRKEAETKLRELQDAISDLGYKVAVWQMYPGKTLDILSQAIQESRTRKK